MSKVGEYYRELEEMGIDDELRPNEKDYKVIAHALKDMLKEEPLSNCCYAPFTYPGYPDSDICSSCKEHAGVDEDE